MIYINFVLTAVVCIIIYQQIYYKNKERSMINSDLWAYQANVFDASQLPILCEMDAVVVGGGAAGVSAATNLAEKNHSVLLIEKYGFCGGGAVAGLSGTICGMYLASDTHADKPEQVVFGFTDRFRSRLYNRGGLTEPQRYGKTWTVTHDPLMWRETADSFLTDAKVNILFHCQVVGVLRRDNLITGLVVNSKSGMGVVLTKVVIDASGDADVVHRAGWGSTKGDNGFVQNPTMIFRLGGVDVHAFLQDWGNNTISPEHIIQKIIAADATGNYDLPRKKIWIFPTTRPGELMVNATRILGFDNRDLDVTNPIDHTEAELVSRHQMRHVARFLKDHVDGCQQSYVVDTGVEVGIRQTRSIVGIERLKNDYIVSASKSEHGIVTCPWPIELHAGGKPKVEWIMDDYYEVPYGTLVPENGDNIIVAGRCLSAEHEALASARVTAQCFGYGHAAATAAHMVLTEDVQFRDIQGKDVRHLLNKENAQLG